MTTPLHYQSATDIASQIIRRKVSAREVLEHFLSRIDRYNPTLNALIWLDVDGARRTADAADAALDRGQVWGPLHGVPMTIKESYQVAGSPTTWGHPDFRNNVTETDAITVDRLKKAGVNLFGKSNVPLMLADWQTFNEIYGTTSNPWDTTRTPGGSSGGSAAALAAGLTGLEAGSDIGASIRNPAHYCGVFGHKPTYGVVTPRGQSLPDAYATSDISVIGPMARSARDLETGLRVMAGPDAVDGIGWSLTLPAPRRRRLSDFRVALKFTDPNVETDAAYVDALQHLADRLAKAGATVKEIEPDVDTRKLFENYVLLLRAATSGRVPQSMLDLAERVVQGPDDGSYLYWMSRGNLMAHREWLGHNNERHRMRYAFAEFFKDWDILLCPAAAGPAFPKDEAGVRHDRTIAVNGKQVYGTEQIFWAGYSCNVYLPATVGPAGLVGGLPVGYQAVAGQYWDYTAIEFAKLVEQEIVGFQPPPGYDD
ncbi:MAG: amidase [Alphaproteobacteria bacterium]|nr:amidase [Alphaproteobacteria bacterium]MCB9929152.1 amidase [Alphaproteobacteria bacterium]